MGEFLGIPLSHRVPIFQVRGLRRRRSRTLPVLAVGPHGAMYISRGPSQVRIWKEVDPVTRQITAWHAEWLRSIDNPYYMDGRPRPSDLAAHTWGGFRRPSLWATC